MTLKEISVYLVNLFLMLLLVIFSLFLAYQLVVNETSFKGQLNKINYSEKSSIMIEQLLSDYVREEIVTSLDIKGLVSSLTDESVTTFFDSKEKLDKDTINNGINARIKNKLQTYFETNQIEVSSEVINSTSLTLSKQINNHFFLINEFSLLEGKTDLIENYSLYIIFLILTLTIFSIFILYMISKKRIFHNSIKILLSSIGLIGLIMIIIKSNNFYYMNSHTSLLINNLITNFNYKLGLITLLLVVFTLCLLFLNNKQKLIEKNF